MRAAVKLFCTQAEAAHAAWAWVGVSRHGDAIYLALSLGTAPGEAAVSNQPVTRGYVVGPGEGVPGRGPDVKASGRSTGGSLTVIEATIDGGPPRHTHSREDEGFYVLDGLITRDWTALWDAIKHLILPAIALGSIPLAIITRITRAAVLDVKGVRIAFAGVDDPHLEYDDLGAVAAEDGDDRHPGAAAGLLPRRPGPGRRPRRARRSTSAHSARRCSSGGRLECRAFSGLSCTWTRRWKPAARSRTRCRRRSPPPHPR